MGISIGLAGAVRRAAPIAEMLAFKRVSSRQRPARSVDSPGGGHTLALVPRGAPVEELRVRLKSQPGCREKPFEPDPGHAGEGTGPSVRQRFPVSFSRCG